MKPTAPWRYSFSVLATTPSQWLISCSLDAVTRHFFGLVGFAVILFSGCTRTLYLSLPSDTPVRLVTYHEDSIGISRPYEMPLPRDAPEWRRLQEWLAHNQSGWSQSMAINPSGGFFVRAGDLNLQFVGTTVFAFTDHGQFQKDIRQEDYAYLKEAAGM
jgi:hypothetical protein